MKISSSAVVYHIIYSKIYLLLYHDHTHSHCVIIYHIPMHVVNHDIDKLYMKSFIAKQVNSILVNLRYLRF